MHRPTTSASRAIALAAAFALTLGSCRAPVTAARPSVPADLSAFVRVEAVALDAHGAAIVAQGSVTFDEERVAAIIPPVQGRVIRLLAAPGDHVARGAPLASVYSTEVAGERLLRGDAVDARLGEPGAGAGDLGTVDVGEGGAREDVVARRGEQSDHTTLDGGNDGGDVALVEGDAALGDDGRPVGVERDGLDAHEVGERNGRG